MAGGRGRWLEDGLREFTPPTQQGAHPANRYRDRTGVGSLPLLVMCQTAFVLFHWDWTVSVLYPMLIV